MYMYLFWWVGSFAVPVLFSFFSAVSTLFSRLAISGRALGCGIQSSDNGERERVQLYNIIYMYFSAYMCVYVLVR